MKIAVLSDTRAPTHPDFPGHGLGKMVLTIADGLADRGHDVTVFAASGSKFERGELVTSDDERQFLPVNYEAVLDNTHQHTLQQRLPNAAIVNVSHDREGRPGRCAVFPSDAHRQWWGYKELTPSSDGLEEGAGVVIHNAVDVPPMPDVPRGDYYAYLSMFHSPKAPVMAVNVARLAGVPLVMAGPTPPAPPAGAKYIGPLFGQDKLDFLAGAKALIFPASTEAGPVTILEAQAVGCPVIVFDQGAARENMQDGVTGFVASDTLSMVDAIQKIDRIDRAACVEFVRTCRNVETMVSKYELILKMAACGQRW